MLRERREEGSHLNYIDLFLNWLWSAELPGTPAAFSLPSLQVLACPTHTKAFLSSPSWSSPFSVGAKLCRSKQAASASPVQEGILPQAILGVWVWFFALSQQCTMTREEGFFSYPALSLIFIYLFLVSLQVSNKQATATYHALQSVLPSSSYSLSI